MQLTSRKTYKQFLKALVVFRANLICPLNYRCFKGCYFVTLLRQSLNERGFYTCQFTDNWFFFFKYAYLLVGLLTNSGWHTELAYNTLLQRLQTKLSFIEHNFYKIISLVLYAILGANNIKMNKLSDILSDKNVSQKCPCKESFP